MCKYFFVFIILISSCKSDEVEYYNYDKWKVPRDYFAKSLINKPKEVDEILYYDLSDTSDSKTINEVYHNKWQFNNEGDLFYYKAYTEKGSWIVVEMKFDKNGFQSVSRAGDMSNNDNSIVDQVISLKQSDGRILRKELSNNNKFSFVTYYTGDSIKVENLEKADENSKVASIDMEYYKGNFIQKHTTINRQTGNETISKYFYSANNYLDSILTLKNNQISAIDKFVNNEHGDPISCISLSNLGDTIELINTKYEYDENGNWIKAYKSKRARYANDTLVDAHPDYELIVRKIKY